MHNAEYLVAEIRMDERDGCFHVYSDEIPGFHLCVQQLVEDIDQDISSAIEYFFQHARNQAVRVTKAGSPLQLLQPQRPSHQNRFVMTSEFAVA